MKKSDSEVLIHLVNSKSHMDYILYYMNLRIETLKELLVVSQDIENVRRLQGAIEELKRLRNLRDEVLNPKD